MHASPVSRFSRTSAPAITFHDRQFRRHCGAIRQPWDTLEGGVASRCQFAADISHDTLDRIVRDDGVPDFAQNYRGTLKGSRLCGGEGDPFD
jgi:hypothetical protein